MSRGIFTPTLPAGDYTLSTSGLTWNVDRATASGSVFRIIAGEQDKETARERLLAFAEGERADAWESLGPASYRLIKRYR